MGGESVLKNQRADIVRKFVTTIPRGQVMSYKSVGEATPIYVTAREVGSIMRHSAGFDIPWWRVIGSDGRMATAKLDPRLADEQVKLLEAEGVVFDGNKVSSEYFWLA